MSAYVSNWAHFSSWMHLELWSTLLCCDSRLISCEPLLCPYIHHSVSTRGNYKIRNDWRQATIPSIHDNGHQSSLEVREAFLHIVYIYIYIYTVYGTTYMYQYTSKTKANVKFLTHYWNWCLLLHKERYTSSESGCTVMCSNWFQSRDMCACVCIFPIRVHLCLTVWLSIHIPIAYRKYCIEHKRHKSLTLRGIFMSEVSSIQVFIAHDSATSFHHAMMRVLWHEPVLAGFEEQYACLYTITSVASKAYASTCRVCFANSSTSYHKVNSPDSLLVCAIDLCMPAAFVCSIMLKDSSTTMTVKALTRETHCSSYLSQHK